MVQIDITVVDREVRLERVPERRRLLAGVVSLVRSGREVRDRHSDQLPCGLGVSLAIILSSRKPDHDV